MPATATYGKPYTLEGPRGGRYAWTIEEMPRKGVDRGAVERQAVLTVFWSPIDQRYTVALHQAITWSELGVIESKVVTDVPRTITYVNATDQTRAQVREFARAQRDAVSGTEVAFTAHLALAAA